MTFNLLMISAGMEHGGNCLQRHLDGHPELACYPFESQFGTKYSSNILTPLYHYRYSWPIFPTDISSAEAYDLIYDEEMKTFLNTPERSKFKDCGAIINKDRRKRLFIDQIEDIAQYELPRRWHYIQAYLESSLQSWTNYQNTHDKLKYYVCYYPLSALDADDILNDFSHTKIIHIVRNPWSAYADTKDRPYPLSLEKYCLHWNIVNAEATKFLKKYPDNFYIIRYEDLISKKEEIMRGICSFIGIKWSDILLYPSFNGRELEIIRPWGTIQQATAEANMVSARSLTKDEFARVAIETGFVCDEFYEHKEQNKFLSR